MHAARFVSFLALLVAAVGCAGPRPPHGDAGTEPGSVRVRLMYRESALPDVAVTAVRHLGVPLLEERVAATSDPDGRAGLVLAPGSWYLSAVSGRPAVSGWYGSNPVQVRPDEAVEITIPAVPAVPPPAASVVPAGEESVAGEVVGDTGPVAGATVSFFLDASTQFRGPGYLETRADERGVFEARLSPGSYWLVARRRSGSQPFGPLEAGDDAGYHPANPLQVRTGERLWVRIPAVRVLKKSGWGGPSTLRARVSGVVRDPAGRPLAGYRAFLHAKATMLGKPDFVSDPSGPDGIFQIWVDREGVYYLGARAEIGRAREERETIGLYGGAQDHAVQVRLGVGDLPGRDILVGGGSAP